MTPKLCRNCGLQRRPPENAKKNDESKAVLLLICKAYLAREYPASSRPDACALCAA